MLINEEFEFSKELEDQFDIGLALGYCRRLKFTERNGPVIVNYLKALANEINLSDNYKRMNFTTLVYLSRYLSNKKFTDMTKDDIIMYLNSLRKDESVDRLHSWVSTYNLYLVILTRFFKWLYYPDLSPKTRLKPSCVEIASLKRKEKSVYKPSDMWTQDDDILFLRYCPSKRDRCYHAISRDSSCRPHELLKIRLKDIVFKMAGDKQYAEIVVDGKTGQRQIPLFNSIPYLKDWINDHPQSTNDHAVLICGFGKSLGRSIRIESLNHIYQSYKKQVFPKLLDNPFVSTEDKARIRELIKKPWNPYIRRHSALTEKSKILKEHVLRQHAGWAPSSNMHQKYIHYYGNESNEAILEAFGVISKSKHELDKLKPKQCPNCDEQNKIDARFCSKCRMILSYDEFQESVEQKENEKLRMARIEAKIQTLENEFRTKMTNH